MSALAFASAGSSRHDAALLLAFCQLLRRERAGTIPVSAALFPVKTGAIQAPSSCNAQQFFPPLSTVLVLCLILLMTVIRRVSRSFSSESNQKITRLCFSLFCAYDRYAFGSTTGAVKVHWHKRRYQFRRASRVWHAPGCYDFMIRRPRCGRSLDWRGNSWIWMARHWVWAFPDPGVC